MSQALIPKITFMQWVKYPWAALLICSVFGLGVLFKIIINQNNESMKTCEIEKRDLRQQVNDKDERLNELTTALLIKNGVINEIKKQTDSIVRVKVGDDAVKILKR